MSDQTESETAGSVTDAGTDVAIEVATDETPTTPVLKAEPEATAPDALTKLQADLAAALKEKQDNYDRLLRTAADFDNYRKRSRKDLDEARLKAREELLKDMLPVLDNLDRALAHSQDATASVANVVDGVKLVVRQFEAALERSEVKGFPSVGQPFDPTRHEAVSQLETAAHPPGTVAAELQRGFTIGGRLLRPALVAVAKAPAAPQDS
jgi:molecular chaperone GrpE